MARKYTPRKKKIEPTTVQEQIDAKKWRIKSILLYILIAMCVIVFVYAFLGDLSVAERIMKIVEAIFLIPI